MSTSDLLSSYIERYRNGSSWERDVDADVYGLLKQFNMDWRSDPSSPAARLVMHVAKNLDLSSTSPRTYDFDPLIRIPVESGYEKRLFIYDTDTNELRYVDYEFGNKVGKGTFDMSKLEDGVLRMYAQTQARLADEDRELYRGMFGRAACDVASSQPGDHYVQQRVASWTPRESAARRYTTGQYSGLQHLDAARAEDGCKVVLATHPDPRDVFVSPESAVQSYWEEGEHVLFGRDYEVTSVEPGDVSVVHLAPAGPSHVLRAVEEQLTEDAVRR